MATSVKWSIQPKTSWKDAFGDVELNIWFISAQGEGKRVTASQSHREMPLETAWTWVAPGRDKWVNRVSVWPGVQGFCSDNQELEKWTWSEAEIKEISDIMKHKRSLQNSSVMTIQCLVTTFSIFVQIWYETLICMKTRPWKSVQVINFYQISGSLWHHVHLNFEGCSQCPSDHLIIAHHTKALIRKISGALNLSLHFAKIWVWHLSISCLMQADDLYTFPLCT